MMMPLLTSATLKTALADLTARDPDLARVVAEFGPPPLWPREPGYATLIHIILEQQVSLASAKAAMDRLLAAADPLTPERFLKFDDSELKRIGFSRQKTRYVRLMSQAVLDGSFGIDALPGLPDDEVRAALTRLIGIGRWTADIYLLMALLRPDVWPVGDLALATAAREVKNLPSRPTPEGLDAMGEAWRPYRAVAARVLWHHYLSVRKISE
jgi:DNA-3-methyladenine glycosylase II